uniref:Endonuclease n=1 Tax=Schlesneria paludicola TaxID=360056 RepID=A0A7C2K0F8_9PLAN
MRVLSYNIHKGIGGRDRRYRLDRILAVIEQEQPDFICLQEVDRNVRRSGFHNQPELLGDHFHYDGRLFQFNVKVANGGYGNLLLSRWAFEEHHQLSLTLRRKKPRGAQWAVINTPLGPFRLVNWHLGLAEQERHWQVRWLLEHHKFRMHAHLPTLIIGDTNDWRNTLANGPFAVHGYHQVTSPPSRFRSFPAYLPVGALDKAFSCGGVEVQRVHVARSRLARDASDHLPLIVDFEITPPPGSRSLPVANAPFPEAPR